MDEKSILIMGGKDTTACYMLNTENNEVQPIDNHPGEHKFFISPSELKIRDNVYTFGINPNTNACSVFELNTTTKKSIEYFPGLVRTYP